METIKYAITTDVVNLIDEDVCITSIILIENDNGIVSLGTSSTTSICGKMNGIPLHKI
jgi:hypothetical protein